jgi:hypothetical protein
MTENDAPIGLEMLDRDTDRYTGPEGAVAIPAGLAMERGESIVRGGRRARAYDVGSMHWAAGVQAGEAVPDDVRDAIVGRLRAYLLARGEPYDLRFASGRIEDEAGRVRDGFRTVLPWVEHSAGWGRVELWLSRERPEPDDYPPSITYRDENGQVEIPRRIELVGTERRAIVTASAMRRAGDRAGAPIEAAERKRIVERVRLVYDTWGPPVEFR